VSDVKVNSTSVDRGYGEVKLTSAGLRATTI